MSVLPTLFISHGAPTFALDPGASGRELAALAQELPLPRAILVASPHWMSPTLALTTSARMATIHDFGGFPQALYEMRYPAAGAPDIATRAIELLTRAGLDATAEPRRGLDHGAWIPLRHMYPDAAVPVAQISMQTNGSPRHFYELGRTLAPLKDDGVLLIGSGSITHNLYEFDGRQRAPEAYVETFTAWIADKLATRDLDALLDYRRRAPNAQRAHPTDEHLMPLLFALGAAGEEAVARRLAARDVRFGMLAMDTYVFATQSSLTTNA